MSQTTLDDDDLFGEAAAEVREDVETHLQEARDALPAVSAIWDVEAENTLGVMNALRSGLDVEEANAHLRDAKKWYTMGERADAFDDGADLEAGIEEVESVLSQVAAAREAVDELTTTLPELRNSLEEVHGEADE